MNNLPLKIFYTLEEATAVLNARCKTTEINEDYFFHLAIREEIRIGVFAKPDFKENDIGVLYSCWVESDEADSIEHLKNVDALVKTLHEAGAILILHASSIKDILLNAKRKLKETYFNNVYSIDTQECAVIGKFEEDYVCSAFYDKLEVQDFYEHVYYSEKYDAIHRIHIEPNTLSFPENEQDDDWKVAAWFNFNFNQDMEQFQSAREICKGDCLILGEDLELLLDGKKREPIAKHPRMRLDQIKKTELNAKLHPKRQNSINQIVYGLAQMANLDLSQHQSAYSQFDAFCSQHGIEIPAKDTCGNLFKEVHNKINF